VGVRWAELSNRLLRGLGPDLERAGWNESPERLSVGIVASAGAGLLLALALGTVLGPAAAALLVPAGVAAPPLLWWRSLLAAGRRRSGRLNGELAPLLELICLELDSGSSLGTALESVATRLEGELSADLRPLLVGARVGGTATLQERLDAYAELHRVPSLKSLAALCALSRDYGSGAAQGARALAADLRRAQRRELIVISRRALNRVLIPAAIGILLPFMAVLMFPAVVTLFRNFQ
jgi:Flp pilus assembly protein TadB